MELQHKLRKTLIVPDNCAAHTHVESLKNIQLEFLSPNTTSLDMRIIKKFEGPVLHKVGKLHP
jgi:hypothetical protein